MNVMLDVPVGKWRDLTQEELDTINRMVDESSKTEEASKLSKENSKTRPERSSRERKSFKGRKRRDRKS